MNRQAQISATRETLTLPERYCLSSPKHSNLSICTQLPRSSKLTSCSTSRTMTNWKTRMGTWPIRFTTESCIVHVRQTKSDGGLQSETQSFRMSLGLVFGVFSRRWRVSLGPPFGKGVPTMARHLTMEDRDRIAELKHRGARQNAIARALIRSPSTICRELKRNGSSRNTL